MDDHFILLKLLIFLKVLFKNIRQLSFYIMLKIFKILKLFNKAFTLFEVLIAMAIMGIALTAVYKLYFQTITMAETSKFHVIAPFLAQKKIAELELNFFDSSGDFEAEFNGYSWSVAIESLQSESLRNLSDRLKKIEIVISQNKSNLKYKIRTYKFIKD